MATQVFDCSFDGVEVVSTGAITNTAATISFGNDVVPRHALLKFALPPGWLFGKSITNLTLTLRSATINSTSFNQTLFLEKQVAPADLTGGAFSLSTRVRTSLGSTFGAFTLLAWDQAPPGTYPYSTGNASASLLQLYNTLLSDLVTAGAIPTVADTQSIASLTFLFIYVSGNGERTLHSRLSGFKPTLSISFDTLDRVWSKSVRVLRSDSQTVRI